MTPNTYPIPEYRPSTPQSAAQPEMVDIVRTYSTATRDKSSAARIPEEIRSGAGTRARKKKKKQTHRNDR